MYIMYKYTFLYPFFWNPLSFHRRGLFEGGGLHGDLGARKTGSARQANNAELRTSNIELRTSNFERPEDQEGKRRAEKSREKDRRRKKEGQGEEG